MSEEEKTGYRQKLVNELISIGSSVILIFAITMMTDDALRERMKMRVRRIVKPEHYDPYDGVARQFAQEVSDWDHAEREKSK